MRIECYSWSDVTEQIIGEVSNNVGEVNGWCKLFKFNISSCFFDIFFYYLSVALSPYFEKFIQSQIKSGRYNNGSEVIRAGLRA